MRKGEEGMNSRKTPGSTGISRRVLLALDQQGGVSTADLLEFLRSSSSAVTVGNIWTILDRARHNGLVSRIRKGRTYLYSLTGGGERRTKWIRKEMAKTKEQPKPGKAEGRA